MPATPSDTAAPGPCGTRRFLLVWAAVSAIVVLAHFAFAPRMGLYEDDHWLIGVPMCEWDSAGQLWTTVKRMFAIHFQGRPLCFAIGNSLTYLGTSVAGLTGAYVLAVGVWVANAGLCLALLWRPFGPVAATTAALVFVLLPADTTHPLLHGALYVHPSVTFLLLSGLAYSRGRSVLSVVLAAGTLLTYETCFLPALVWPILFRHPDRPLWRRVLVHGLVMGLVLVAAVLVRVQVGESRVAGAITDKWALAKKVRELVVVGPKSAFLTFIDRPIWVVKTWRTPAAFSNPGPGRNTTGGVALAAGAAALLALVVARRAARGEPVPAPGAGAEAPPGAGPRLPVGRVVLSGALMVVLSYVASVSRAPEIVDGRMSSVHIGSTLGWGLFCGGLAAGLAGTRAAPALVPALAAYFCLLAAFHVYVQREFVRAWIAQGEFWRDVVTECPDVGPGTVILYSLGAPTSRMVRHQDWADHLIFYHLFAIPADWSAPPRAFGFGLRAPVPTGYAGYDWNEVAREGDQLYWNHWDGSRVRLEPGNVILLQQVSGGRYERVTGTVRMAGVDLPLKPRGGPTFAFQPNKLYPIMFPKGLQPETHRRVSR